MKLSHKQKLVSGGALVAAIVALGFGQALLQRHAEAQGSSVSAPMFEVDPLWPKPLPNHWLLGWTIGVWVDEQDHVWIVHRGAGDAPQQRDAAPSSIRRSPSAAAPRRRFWCSIPTATWCGHGAAPARDTNGRSRTTASMSTTRATSGSAATAPKDAHILKFTKDGKFLMQVGHFGKTGGSNDTENFGRVAKIWVDPKTNEAYVADGYGNKRVAVIDADTGKMKRYWGAYGNKPDDTNLGPYNPERAAGAAVPQPGALRRALERRAGLCLRPRQRPRAGVPAGRHLREGGVLRQEHAGRRIGVGHRLLQGSGSSASSILADGQNEQVRVILRETLEELTSFGDGGRQPGQFYGVHSIASDSKGNLYTTETYEGKRLQKFVYKGIGSVPRGYQGVPWPKR